MRSYARLLLALFPALIFSGSANAQPIPETHEPIKIPMHILIRPLGILTLFDTHPVVKVQVGSNGHQEKLFFLVDTGCTATMIDAKTAKRLGLPVGDDASTAIGAYSQFVTHNSELPWLRLGPIEEHNLPVQVMNLSKANFIGDVAGILGVDFWQKYMLTIDFRKNYIELNGSHEPNSKRQVLIIPAFSDQQGRLYVTATVNSLHRVPMLLDTCSPTTTMPYELAKQIFAGEMEKYKFSDEEWDVNGGKAKVATVHTQSFRIGDYACTGLIMHVFKENDQGSNVCILGSDFLRNFRVGFDFPHKRLILEK